MKKKGYYSSGEFARMAHVTLRTIRYYDKQDLLKPSFVTESGARFYTDSDFARLSQILLLKYLGFSLDDIREMIIDDTDYHFMENSLNIQLKLVRDRIEQMQLVEKAIQDTTEAIRSRHVIDWNQMLDLIHLTGMEKSMKKQPVIGITGNERPFPDDPDANMSYAATGFVEAVKEAGGIPLILPIGDAALAKDYISMIDKLIITGGQNVLPKFYGEEITIDSDDYLLKRDLFELALIEEARAAKKAIFTVCRGTQLYNVALGGTLHQDIEHHWQDNPGQYTSQELVTKDQTILQEIYGKTSRINSFHHQSIKDLADGLEVIARDPKDDVIEAVQSTDESRFLGVQWHPELRFDKSPADHKLFEYVVNDL